MSDNQDLSFIRPQNRELLENILHYVYDHAYEDNKVDWDKICRDYNITYYETNKVIIPICVGFSDDHFEIYNYPFISRRLREWVKAHEIGHVLMPESIIGDDPEPEVNFFADTITGYMMKWSRMVGAGINICSMRPIYATYWIRKMKQDGDEEPNTEEYITMLRKESKNLRPIHTP